jgi:quinoprotein glucose dehydrogenase
MTKTRIFVCFAALAAGASLIALAQGRGGGGQAGAPAVAGPVGPNWATYGGNLASHRYSSVDQINKDNFRNLRIAWRLKTDFLGPTPDNLYAATPL